MNAGSDENKEREIGQIIEDSYEKYFGEEAINKLSREVTTSDSYFTRAVCEIVEYIYTLTFFLHYMLISWIFEK